MNHFSIYAWEDGYRVHSAPSTGQLSQFIFRTPKVVRLRLYWDPQSRVLSTMPNPSLWVHPPKMSEDEIRKIRGFILDAGFPRAKGPNLVDTGSEDKETKIYYPKWIGEERWGQRYEEAERRVVVGRPPKIEEKWPTFPEDFLGHVENVMLFRDRFVSKTRGPFPLKIWWGSWTVSQENGSDLVDSVREAVDIITDRRLLLPESAREAWEKTNVSKGEFILPSPEEVEVFRILDQELPLLLPHQELSEWITGRWSS